MKMYDQDEIKDLMKRSLAAELWIPAAMMQEAPEVLCQVCNGIGAEWMSERSRKILTKAFKYCELAAAIHDYEYYAQTTSRASADERFLLNALREVRHSYPQWWNWRRWLGERAVLAAYAILERVGIVAWALSAKEKTAE